MKISIINGSPKGKNSTTLQTLLYLEKKYPAHTYEVIHVGAKIKKIEKDFEPIKKQLEQAELIVFAYPVYTFIAPYQLHRFIELIKENHVNLSGKFATQVSTSKHFYDVTAHKYIEENCYDLGLKVMAGLSADMDDLLCEKGQKQAEQFWEHVMFRIEHGIFEGANRYAAYQQQISMQANKQTSEQVADNDKIKPIYQPVYQEVPKKQGVTMAIVTNCDEQDTNLNNMIQDFRAILPYETKLINLKAFKFSGGCLGCFECAVSGKCIYKDGFDDFLRKEIQSVDAIVYAFTIKDHYTEATFKMYDDRQFCNGHRAVTMGMPVGYLISGNYKEEANLQMIVEGRCEVGGNFLSYVATDEKAPAQEIKRLASSIDYAYKNKLSRPQNFYGVGGTKIFRDLIYIMRGLMKADHQFYKAHGVYDFPQKQRKTILKMQCVGWLMQRPSVKKKMKGKMNEAILAPYQKVIDKAGN